MSAPNHFIKITVFIETDINELAKPSHLIIFCDCIARHSPPTFSTFWELDMAKGQMRSTREIKKPKASKPVTAAIVSTLISKGVKSLAAHPKKA
ncbi:hypothetical protein ACQW02_10030 [Humitalea sp. 24SJ18S-53]|uniref:hypothetical protein n=1 Tax=Humitalea sp. 24SJ18S-53 TaxID=3422307 RepID=UPI003D676C10